MNDEQLTQRMRAASEAVKMSDSAQARHLEAISAALEPTATPDAEVIPLPSDVTRRRRIVASVVAAAVMAPAGLAAASEGSLPGDALYPVKQISERVLVLFDSDVIAEHRIEEIEALEASGVVDPDLYDDARAALTELGEDHPLWQRLAAASAPDDAEDDQEISDDDDLSEGESDVAVVELALPDGVAATITLAGDELMAIDTPTGWMVAEIDDDEATLESDSYIVEIEVLSDGSIDVIVTERLADDDESEDTTETTSVNDSDDDESSEAATTSTTAADREDDSDSAETDSNDAERQDDDASELP